MDDEKSPQELRKIAEQRLREAQERAPETYSLVDSLRRIRELNNFAYNIRKAMGG